MKFIPISYCTHWCNGRNGHNWPDGRNRAGYIREKQNSYSVKGKAAAFRVAAFKIGSIPMFMYL